MDKVILFEHKNGHLSMSKGEPTLPEDCLGFILIDQTQKNDNGISYKQVYTVGQPIKRLDLDAFCQSFSLSTLNSESSYTLESLQYVDPNAEWNCVTIVAGADSKPEGWKWEGSYVSFSGSTNLLSRPITNDMIVCSSIDVLDTMYKNIIAKDNRITK